MLILFAGPPGAGRRVENRAPDKAQPSPPSWRAVLDRDYEPWRTDRDAIDTADGDVDAALARLRAALA